MRGTPDTRPRGPAERAACATVVVLCLALAGINGLETRLMSVTHGFPLPWSLIALSILPRWIVLAATLPIVLIAAGRTHRHASRWRAALLHSTLFLAISAVHAVALAWSNGHASPVDQLFPWTARVLRAGYGATPIVLSMYAGVLAAAWAIEAARDREARTLRASQLEAQLQSSRLTALRARLQPHFLYNTLNGIAALVADRRTAPAVAALDHLSELLHSSLQDDADGVVPLGEEMALAERYLALQSIRFGSRLAYEITMEPGVADIPVPVLLLQPLVENAVVHGMEAGRARLCLRVVALRTAAGVEVCVENDGAPLDPAAPRTGGHGVGLAATRARLDTVFGGRASLRLLPRAGGGALVRVHLPWAVLPEALADCP